MKINQCDIYNINSSMCNKQTTFIWCDLHLFVKVRVKLSMFNKIPHPEDVLGIGRTAPHILSLSVTRSLALISHPSHTTPRDSPRARWIWTWVGPITSQTQQQREKSVLLLGTKPKFPYQWGHNLVFKTEWNILAPSLVNGKHKNLIKHKLGHTSV